MNEEIVSLVHAQICLEGKEEVDLTETYPFLSNLEVIQWIFNSKTFVDKQQEDSWGKEITQKVCKRKINKQWTTLFSEAIVKEIYMLTEGQVCTRCPEKNHLKPDLICEKYVIEVKSGTYFTDGTAHEKIPSAAIKYDEVPLLFNKALHIVCMGRAEIYAKQFFQAPMKERRQEQMNLYNKHNIFYHFASDILLEWATRDDRMVSSLLETLTL
jgi:hypothetical protein